MKLLLFFCLLSSAAALSVAEIKIIGLPTCQENPLNDFIQQLTDAVKEILNFVELEIKLIDCYLAEVNVGLGGNTTTTAPSTQAFTSPASNPDTTPGTETSPQNPTDSNNPTDIPSTNGPSLPVPTLPPLK